jgi:hypothetical protein
VLPALAIVLVGYVGVFLYDTSMPPAGQPQTQAVASWLQARHLTSGIGDYWSANITTAATSGRVRVRAVTPTGCGQYAAYVWEAKQAWYQPPEAATFMLTKPDSTTAGAQVPAAAIAQFGRPVQTAAVDGYQIIVWDHNLLPAISSGSCRARWPR